jgi:hypothetical protein
MHPLPATNCLYIQYFDTGKGRRRGRVEPERRLEEKQFTNLGRNTNSD